MVAKSQPAIPPPPPPVPPPPPPPVHLETIYEESGSSYTSSFVDIHQQQARNQQKPSTNSTIQPAHGLISARSIPSVDVHRRRRASEHQAKPPIEVRFRDGTKRYIQPLLAGTTMIVNRRKYSPSSSRHDSSSSTKSIIKHRQIFNLTPKKKKKLPDKSKIILTIITAEDLSQAGITPPSTSSPDESDTLAFTKSHSNSSLDTLKTVTDISFKDPLTVPVDDSSQATVPSPILQNTAPVSEYSMSKIRFSDTTRTHSHHKKQLRYSLQVDTSRSRSLPPSQSHKSSTPRHTSNSNQAPSIQLSTKKFPSLQITVKSDENEKSSSSKVTQTYSTLTGSSSHPKHETTNSEQKNQVRPPATTFGTSGSRSAFRPFLKTVSTQSQAQIVTHQMVQNYSQPSHSNVSSSQPYHQQYSNATYANSMPFTWQTNSILYDRRSLSSDAPKQSLNSFLSNQMMSDNLINSAAHMAKTHYSQPPMSNIIDNSYNPSTIPKDQRADPNIHMVTVDPTLQWHSVTSKSLYDVPRLSDQYANIPLRITIPDGTPTHNQKCLHKHDVQLERRLLDAGLSPETIALYERILEVADIRHKGRIPAPEIIDQYQTKSLLSVVKY